MVVIGWTFKINEKKRVKTLVRMRYLRREGIALHISPIGLVLLGPILYVFNGIRLQIFEECFTFKFRDLTR
jgi:hypothetical protein